eukprot:1137465-Pelagomonas_calceolata.AAC.10
MSHWHCWEVRNRVHSCACIPTGPQPHSSTHTLTSTMLKPRPCASPVRHCSLMGVLVFGVVHNLGAGVCSGGAASDAAAPAAEGNALAPAATEDVAENDDVLRIKLACAPPRKPDKPPSEVAEAPGCGLPPAAVILTSTVRLRGGRPSATVPLKSNVWLGAVGGRGMCSHVDQHRLPVRVPGADERVPLH